MSECPIAAIRQSIGGGVVAVLYGLVAYGLFMVTILYAIGFVGDLWVPKSIDSGPTHSLIATLNVDIALLALFAVQHSVMARPAFKRWWTRLVPMSVERSTYVIFSNAALIVLFWQWQPIPTLLWTIDNEIGRVVLDVMFWMGWGIVFASTFLINHFELFGLRQVFARATNRAIPASAFATPLFYRAVRHPLYLGFLLAFWSTPDMTAGHLVFAIGTTGYILLAIVLEERDLIDTFGEQYRRYRREVRMLLPLPMRRAKQTRRGVARVA
jgi:protein-S-isoprenylcysteine O-methyltransferase Ste14